MHLTGLNNKVSIGEGTRVRNFIATLEGDASLTIGAGCFLGQIHVHLARGANLVIGDGTVINGSANLYLHEPSGLSFGSHCLIGGDCLFATSDMHSIIEIESGKRINWASDIRIGAHVWIGAHCTFLKGSAVGNDTVVGAFAIVTKTFGANCLVVGNPRRVVKEGITWSQELIAPDAPGASSL